MHWRQLLWLVGPAFSRLLPGPPPLPSVGTYLHQQLARCGVLLTPLVPGNSGPSSLELQKGPRLQ